MTTHHPLTTEMYGALFWWHAPDRKCVFVRHADKPRKMHALARIMPDGSVKVSDKGVPEIEAARLGDATRDMVKHLRQIGSADPFNALLNASLEYERQTGTLKQLGNLSTELRKMCKSHEAQNRYKLTDREAMNDLTSKRCIANHMRCILDDQNQRQRPMAIFDWPSKRSKIVTQVPVASSAPSVAVTSNMPDVTADDINTELENLMTSTVTDTVTDTDTNVSPDYTKLAQIANAVGINLEEFIAQHAAPSKTITIDSAATQTDGSMVPAAQQHFTWKGSGWEGATAAMDAASNVGARSVVLVTGPTGCGKTMGALQYGAERKRPVHVVDCSTLQEPTDAFGALVADSGSTKFVPNKTVEVLGMNNAIVVLDEINRATAAVRNAWFALLDGRGTTRIDSVLDEDGNPINVTVAGNVTIIMTANIGAAYRGTDRIDAAFRNRADIEVRVDYLKLAAERALLRKVTQCSKDAANVIATFAQWTREESTKLSGGAVSQAVSTRRTLATATHASRGIDLLDSMCIGMINSIDDDIERDAAMTWASALTNTTTSTING